MIINNEVISTKLIKQGGFQNYQAHDIIFMQVV